MWINPGEIPDNNIDDDGNGYIDDIFGIDAVNDDSNPMDDDFHGTHVAGTIAAVADNSVGISGVCWKARIMAVKCIGWWQSGYDADFIEAIDYVTDMKLNHNVNVVAINASWGGSEYNELLKEAIEAAGNAGIIFIASAGNNSTDSDTTPFYPSSYDLPNIISVAATDQDDNLADFSNYGVDSVDIAAPGVNILSTAFSILPESDDIFYDDMESGSDNWITGGANNSWQLIDQLPEIMNCVPQNEVITPFHAWTDSSNGDYLSDTESYLELNRDIDLRLYKEKSIHIVFSYSINLDDGDILYLDLSSDGGNTWGFNYTFSGQGACWTLFGMPIQESFKTEKFRFRFRLYSDSSLNNDGVYIDDVGIVLARDEYASGTSMAAPHVTGAVALLASEFQGMPVEYYTERIFNSVDTLPSLEGKVKYEGRLNIANLFYNHLIAIDIPIMATEGDNVISTRGTISVNQAPDDDLELILFSSDTSEIIVPDSVIIPAGETSTEFVITVVDDNILDGTQDVNIQAVEEGYHYISKTIQVHDNETAVLSLLIPESAVEGSYNSISQCQVMINSNAGKNIAVTLDSSDKSEVFVPGKVIIPEGHNSVSFNLTVIDDFALDGDKTVSITAYVEGWTSGNDSIVIRDNEILSDYTGEYLSGPEFRINNYTVSDNFNPTVSGLLSGGYIVSWASYGFGILGKHFEYVTDDTAHELNINPYTYGHSGNPAVAYLVDNGFIAVWETEDGGGTGISAQMYNDYGEKRGGYFPVNNSILNNQLEPSAAGLSDGGFVIVWRSDGTDEESYGISGRCFDKYGYALGDEFQVNSKNHPAVTGLVDGGFVVTWQSWQNGSYYDIFGQLYNNAGDKIGGEFQVNTYTSLSQDNVSVAGLAEGGFAFLWTGWWIRRWYLRWYLWPVI
jgi:subtilisin family serine protease